MSICWTYEQILVKLLIPWSNPNVSIKAIQTSILVNFITIFNKFYLPIPDNDLYTGTDADFSGNDPIIYREPLQTDQFDSLSLNGK